MMSTQVPKLLNVAKLSLRSLAATVTLCIAKHANLFTHAVASHAEKILFYQVCIIALCIMTNI